jgi:universal stress protein E
MAKILIIADLQGRGYATPRGLELAAKLGLDADVVAFTYVPLKRLSDEASEREHIKERLLEERQHVVQERLDKHRQEGQKVNLKVVWEKDVDKWVNRACGGDRYVAVVKTGSHTDSLVHTSTDWQLLRECAAPVLIVADKKWHRTRPVLVTLDLGTELAQKRKLNHKVLEVAKVLADALDVELEIIAAIEIPTLLSDLDLVDPIAYTREARAKMQPHIEELAKTHQLSLKVFHVKRGPVEKVITSRAAKVRAQIVVMGTVARTGVKARLLGNTAEKVLRHLKTDVLAIKP